MNFDFDLDLTQSFEMKEVATLKPKSRVNCLLHMRNNDCDETFTDQCHTEPRDVSDSSSTSNSDDDDDDDDHDRDVTI